MLWHRETQEPAHFTYGRARLSNIRMSRTSRSSRSSRDSRGRSSRITQGGRLTQHAPRSTAMSQGGDSTGSRELGGQHRGTVIAPNQRGTVMSAAGDQRGTVIAPNQRGTVMSAAGDQRGTVIAPNQRGTVMSAAGDQRVSTLGLGNHRGTKLGGTRASRASRASHASRFSTASKQLGTVEFVWFTAVAFVPIF